MVTLQRRIEGLPLPLDTRDMTVPQAGRRGGSVGEISTFNGQIGLTRLSGSLGNSGIAISLGIQRPPNT